MIKKTLAAFVAGVFLFNDISAYALSPESRLSDAAFRPLFQAGYTLLANEAVNEYVEKYLISRHTGKKIEWITDADVNQFRAGGKKDITGLVERWWRNRVVIEDDGVKEADYMVVSIPGLLKNTGQTGHVGLGRWNGMPVAYMDDGYYYDQAAIEKAIKEGPGAGSARRQEAIIHEIDEIRQYEQERHDLQEVTHRDVSYGDMRRMLNQHPSVALALHGDSRTLDRLYKEIRLDPNSIDLAAIYELYRKHGLASNTPAHPLARADKSPRGGVNIAAGSSASDIEDTEQDYVGGQVFERLIELNRHEEDSAWKYSHRQGIKEYLSGQDRHMVAQAFYKYYDSLNQIEQYYNSNRSERITRHRVGSFVFSPNLPPKYEEDIIKAICQSFRRFYGTTGDYSYRSFDLHMASLKAEVLHLLLELEPDVIEDFLAAVERETDLGRKYALQIKSLLDHSPKKNALINTMFKRGRDDPIFAYGPTLFMTFAEDVADSVPEFDGYKIMSFDRLVDQIGEDDDRTFAALVAIDIAISKVYPSGGGIYSSVIDRVGASWAAWEKFLSGLEKVLDTSEDPFVLRTALGLYERMAGVGETKKNARLTRVCLKAVEKVSDIETRHWLLSSLIVNVLKNEDIRSQVTKIVMDKLFNFLADRTNNNITPIHITMDEWYLRNGHEKLLLDLTEIILEPGHFAAKRKIREDFLKLLSLLNRNWWLLEDPERGYNDKTAFEIGTIRNAPDKGAVFDWSDHDFCDRSYYDSKLNIAERIINDRIPMAREGKIRPMSTEDQQEMFRLAQSLGISITDSSPTTGTPAKSVYLSANGLWKLVELSERLPFLISSLLKWLEVGLDKLFYGTTNFTDNYRITTFNALLKSGWTKDELIREIVGLSLEAFGEEEDIEAKERQGIYRNIEMHADKDEIFIATDGTKIIGSVIAQANSEKIDVSNLVVKPEYQSERVGTRLMNSVTEWTRAGKIRRISIFAVEDEVNGVKPSVEFYDSYFARNNFKIIHRIKDKIYQPVVQNRIKFLVEIPPDPINRDGGSGGLGFAPLGRTRYGEPAGIIVKNILGLLGRMLVNLWTDSGGSVGAKPGEVPEKPSPETVLHNAARKILYENWMKLYSSERGSRRRAVEQLGPLVAALIKAGEEVDLQIFVEKLNDEEEVSYEAAHTLRQINLALIEKGKAPVGIDKMSDILRYSFNKTIMFGDHAYFVNRAVALIRTLGDIDEALIKKGKAPLSIKEIRSCLNSIDGFLRDWAVFEADKINKASGKTVYDLAAIKRPRMISEDSIRNIIRSGGIWRTRPVMINSGRDHDFKLVSEGKDPLFTPIYKEELPGVVASYKEDKNSFFWSDVIRDFVISIGEVDAALLARGKETGGFKMYMDLLKDESSTLRRAAIRALGEIGSVLSSRGDNVPFLNELGACMEDNDGQAAFAAVREIGRIKYYSIKKNGKRENLELLSHFEGRVRSLLSSEKSKGKTEYNRIILAYIEALGLMNVALIETGGKPRTSMISEVQNSGSRELTRTVLDTLADINTALLKARKPCLPMDASAIYVDEYLSRMNSPARSLIQSFIESGKFRYDNAGFLISEFWLEHELWFDDSILNEYFNYPDAATFLISLEKTAKETIEKGFNMYDFRARFSAYLAARLTGILVSFREFAERLNSMMWFEKENEGYFRRLFNKGRKLKALEISASGIRELDTGRVDGDVLDGHLKDLNGIKTRIDDFSWLVESFPGYKLFSLNNLYFQFKREQAIASGELKPGERFRVQYPQDSEMETAILQDKALLLNLILRNIYYQVKRDESIKSGQLKEGEHFRIEFPAADEIKKELIQKKDSYYKLVFSILAGKLLDRDLHDKCVTSMRDIIVSQILEDRTFVQQLESPNIETKLQMFKVLYEDYVNHLPGIAGMNLGELSDVAQSLKMLAKPFYEEASKTHYVLGTTKHSFTLVPAGFLSFCHGRAGVVDCAFDMDKGQAFTRAMHEDTDYYFIYKAKELIGYIGIAWGRDDNGSKVLTIDSIESPIFDGEELIMNLLKELHEYAIKEGAIGIALPRDIHFFFNFDNQDTVGNLKVYREGEPVHVVPVHNKSWKSMTEWFGRTGDDRYIGNSMDSEEFVLLKMSDKQPAENFSYEKGKMLAAETIRNKVTLTQKKADKILERLNDVPGFTWKFAEWGVHEQVVIDGSENPGLDGFFDGFSNLERNNRWSLMFHASNQDGRGDVIAYFLSILEDIPELEPVVNVLKDIRRSCSKKADIDDLVRRDLTAIGFMEGVYRELVKMATGQVEQEKVDSHKAVLERILPGRWKHIQNQIMRCERVFNKSLRQSEDNLRTTFEDPESIALVVKYNGRIMGYAAGLPLERYQGMEGIDDDKNFGRKNTVYLESIVVMPDFQGGGLGSILRNTFLEIAKQSGYKFVTSHQRKSIALERGDEILAEFGDWDDNGTTFEYSRTDLKSMGKDMNDSDAVGTTDITIAGNGWKDMTRRGHELFHDNLGKEMLLIWEMLKEGAIESNIPIEGYRQYTHRKGMHYPIRLLAKEIMKRAGKKEIMLNNSHGLRINIRIDDDGIMTIINPRFNVNHAGRNEMAVYARDERGVVHEKEELMLWRDYARDPASGVVPYGIIGLPENSWMHGIGDEITEWANRMRRDGKLEEVQKIRRRFHQLACRAEFEYVLNHTPGISEEAKGLIWQKIGLRYEAAEYLMENCADIHVVSSRPGSDDGDLLFISPVEKKFVISETCLKSHSPQWIEHRIVTYNHYRKLLGNFSHLEDKLAAEIAAETLAMSVLVNKCRPDEHGRREYSARDLNSELIRITGDRSGEWGPEQELKLFKAIKERFLSGLIEENRRNELHEVPDHVIDIIRAKMAAELERLLRDEEKNKEIRVDDEIDPVIKSEREGAALEPEENGERYADIAYRCIGFFCKRLGFRFTGGRASDMKQSIILAFLETAKECGRRLTDPELSKIGWKTITRILKKDIRFKNGLKNVKNGAAEKIEPRTFGGRVQKILIEKGIVQGRLAAKLGVKPSTVSLWVNDRQFPLPHIMPLLAEELGTGVIYLITGMDEDEFLNQSIKDKKSPEYKSLVGFKIRVMRYVKGLTLKEAADRIGVTKQVFSIWEEGRGFPSPKNLSNLSSMLGTTTKALLGLERRYVDESRVLELFKMGGLYWRYTTKKAKLYMMTELARSTVINIAIGALTKDDFKKPIPEFNGKTLEGLLSWAKSEFGIVKLSDALKKLKGYFGIEDMVISPEKYEFNEKFESWNNVYEILRKHMRARVTVFTVKEYLRKSELNNETAIALGRDVRAGNSAAREAMNIAYERVNDKLADKYHTMNPGIPKERFAEAGLAALSRCVDSFDPERGSSFISYIRSHIFKGRVRVGRIEGVMMRLASSAQIPKSKDENLLNRRGFLGAVIGAAVAMKLISGAAPAQAQGLNVDVSPKIDESNGEWPQDIRARVVNALRTLAFHRDVRYQQIEKIHRHDLDGGRMRFWVEQSRDWGILQPTFIDIIFTKEDFTGASLKEHRIEEFEEGVLGRAYVGPERQGTSLIEYLLDALLAALVIIPTIFFSREAFKKYVRYYRNKNEREALHRQHQDDIAAAYRTAGRRGWSGRKNRRGMLSMSSSDDRKHGANKPNPPNSNQVRNDDEAVWPDSYHDAKKGFVFSRRKFAGYSSVSDFLRAKKVDISETNIYFKSRLFDGIDVIKIGPSEHRGSLEQLEAVLYDKGIYRLNDSVYPVLQIVIENPGSTIVEPKSEAVKSAAKVRQGVAGPFHKVPGPKIEAAPRETDPSVRTGTLTETSTDLSPAAKKKSHEPFGPKATTSDGNPRTNRGKVLEKQREATAKKAMEAASATAQNGPVHFASDGVAPEEPSPDTTDDPWYTEKNQNNWTDVSEEILSRATVKVENRLKRVYQYKSGIDYEYYATVGVEMALELFNGEKSQELLSWLCIKGAYEAIDAIRRDNGRGAQRRSLKPIHVQYPLVVNKKGVYLHFEDLISNRLSYREEHADGTLRLNKENMLLLSPAARLIVELSCLNGETEVGIARILGRDEETVKYYMRMIAKQVKAKKYADLNFHIKHMVSGDFGGRLLKIREAIGLSQKEMGYSIGVGESTFNQWERGVSYSTYNKVFLISEKYGIPIEYIINGKGDEEAILSELRSRQVKKLPENSRGVGAAFYNDDAFSKKLPEPEDDRRSTSGVSGAGMESVSSTPSVPNKSETVSGVTDGTGLGLPAEPSPEKFVICTTDGKIITSVTKVHRSFLIKLRGQYGDLLVRKKLTAMPGSKRCQLSIGTINKIGYPLECDGKISLTIMGENGIMTASRAGDVEANLCHVYSKDGHLVFSTQILRPPIAGRLAQKYGGIEVSRKVRSDGKFSFAGYQCLLTQYAGQTIRAFFDERGAKQKLTLPAIPGVPAHEVDISAQEGTAFSYYAHKDAIDRLLKTQPGDSPFLKTTSEGLGDLIEKVATTKEMRDFIKPLVASAPLSRKAAFDLLRIVDKARKAAFQRIGENEEGMDDPETVEWIIGLFERGKHFPWWREAPQLSLSHWEKYRLRTDVTRGLDAQDVMLKSYAYTAIEAISENRQLMETLRKTPEALMTYYNNGMRGLRRAVWIYDPADGTEFTVFAKRCIEDAIANPQPPKSRRAPRGDIRRRRKTENGRYEWLSSNEERGRQNVIDAVERHRPHIIRMYKMVDRLGEPEKRALQDEIYGIGYYHFVLWGISGALDKRCAPYFNADRANVFMSIFPKLGLDRLGFELDFSSKESRRASIEYAVRRHTDLFEQYENINFNDLDEVENLRRQIYGLGQRFFAIWGIGRALLRRYAPEFEGHNYNVYRMLFPKLNLDPLGFKLNWSGREMAIASLNYIFEREIPLIIDRYSRIEVLSGDEIAELRKDIYETKAAHFKVWGLKAALNAKQVPYFDGSYINAMLAFFDNPRLAIRRDGFLKRANRSKRYRWGRGLREDVENVMSPIRRYRPDIITRYGRLDKLSRAQIEILKSDIYKIQNGHFDLWGIGAALNRPQSPHFEGSHRKALQMVFDRLALDPLGFGLDSSRPEESLEYVLRREMRQFMREYDNLGDDPAPSRIRALQDEVYKIRRKHLQAWKVEDIISKYRAGDYTGMLVNILPKLYLSRLGFEPDFSSREAAIESIRFTIGREEPAIAERYADIAGLTAEELEKLREDIYAVSSYHFHVWALWRVLDAEKVPWFGGSYVEALCAAFDDIRLGLEKEGFIYRKKKPAVKYVSDEIAEKYLPLMEQVSAREARRTGAGDPKSFISGAMVGLKEMLSKYPESHPGFLRILRTAMRRRVIDQIRKEGIMARSMRKAVERVREARWKLKEEGNANPSLAQLSEASGLDVEKLTRKLRAAKPFLFSAYERMKERGDFGDASVDNILVEPGSAEDRGGMAEFMGMDKEVVLHKSGLTAQERRVIELYCYDSNRPTFREISREIGYSESRTAQIFYSAVRQLKKVHNPSAIDNGENDKVVGMPGSPNVNIEAMVEEVFEDIPQASLEEVVAELRKRWGEVLDTTYPGPNLIVAIQKCMSTSVMAEPYQPAVALPPPANSGTLSKSSSDMSRAGTGMGLSSEPSPEPMQGAESAGDKTALNYIFDESLAKKLAGELANDLKPFLEQMRTALDDLNKEKDAKLQKKHFDEIRKAAMNIISHVRAMPGSDGKKDKTNDILRDSVQSGGAASNFDFANTLSPIVSIGGMSVNLKDWMDDIKEGVEKSEQISGLITAYANSDTPTVFIKGSNGEVYIDFRASAPQSAETAEGAAVGKSGTLPKSSSDVSPEGKGPSSETETFLKPYTAQNEKPPVVAQEAQQLPSLLAMMGVQNAILPAKTLRDPHSYQSKITDILGGSDTLQGAYLGVVYPERDEAFAGLREFDAANSRELTGELGNGMPVPEPRLSGLGFESWNTLDLPHDLPPYKSPTLGAGHVTGGDDAGSSSTVILQNDHKITAAVGSAENVVSSVTTAQDEGVVETGLLNVVRTDAVPGDVAYIDNIPIERMDSHQTPSVYTSIPVYTTYVKSFSDAAQPSPPATETTAAKGAADSENSLPVSAKSMPLVSVAADGANARVARNGPSLTPTISTFTNPMSAALWTKGLYEEAMCCDAKWSATVKAHDEVFGDRPLIRDILIAGIEAVNEQGAYQVSVGQAEGVGLTINYDSAGKPELLDYGKGSSRYQEVFDDQYSLLKTILGSQSSDLVKISNLVDSSIARMLSVAKFYLNNGLTEKAEKWEEVASISKSRFAPYRQTDISSSFVRRMTEKTEGVSMSDAGILLGAIPATSVAEETGPVAKTYTSPAIPGLAVMVNAAGGATFAPVTGRTTADADDLRVIRQQPGGEPHFASGEQAKPNAIAREKEKFLDEFKTILSKLRTKAVCPYNISDSYVDGDNFSIMATSEEGPNDENMFEVGYINFCVMMRKGHPWYELAWDNKWMDGIKIALIDDNSGEVVEVQTLNSVGRINYDNIKMDGRIFRYGIVQENKENRDVPKGDISVKAESYQPAVTLMPPSNPGTLPSEEGVRPLMQGKTDERGQIPSTHDARVRSEAEPPRMGRSTLDGSASDVLMTIRDGKEPGGLLDQALAVGVAINAEAARILVALGIVEQVDGISTAAVNGSERHATAAVIARYVLTGMMRGRIDEREETRNLINVVCDARVKMDEEECWLGRKGLSKSETLIAGEIILSHVVDHIATHVKESEPVQKVRTINIWDGYANKQAQKAVLQEVERLTEKGPYIVKFCDIEELVSIVESPDNVGGAVVTILPLDARTEGLKSAAGRVIFVNPDTKDFVYELGQIEGLIGIGRAYLNNDEDSFNRLYRLLAVNPQSGIVPLSKLKSDPKKLQFILKSIAPHDYKEHRTINDRLTYLLRHA